MNKLPVFHDKSLFKQALRLSHNGRPAGYERLEFLGDRVLGLVVAEMLYRRFPNEREGAMAKRFVALVREETLAGVAQDLGLPALLSTNETVLRHNASVLSDVCEAIIAALYLDQGLAAVQAFMDPIWSRLIEAEVQIPQDAKSALQEWAQKKFKILPTYTLLSRTGPDHSPVFTVQVQIGDRTITGTGSNKKLAEQSAATNFLEDINHADT